MFTFFYKLFVQYPTYMKFFNSTLTIDPSTKLSNFLRLAAIEPSSEVSFMVAGVLIIISKTKTFIRETHT